MVQGTLAGGGGDIGNEHIGQSIEARSIARPATDINRRAVHVKLWGTTHFCKPGPGKGPLAIRNTGRKLVLKGLGALDTGAASLDALDDLEYRVLRGHSVGSIRELARSASVDSAAIEFKLLGFANLHRVHLSDLEAILALARKLISRDGGLVNLDLVGGVGNRVGNGDVGVGSRNEGRSREESRFERHLRFVGSVQRLKVVSRNVCSRNRKLARLGKKKEVQS